MTIMAYTSIIFNQEDGRKSSIEAWSVPSMTYAIICRSCRDGVCIVYAIFLKFPDTLNV